ncbi:MAG: phosphodiester glycosidase family protein [Clostridiales bacterium]|nr:phosphodiester glycosidase family protein [Clostridiales bacterium]
MAVLLCLFFGCNGTGNTGADAIVTLLPAVNEALPTEMPAATLSPAPTPTPVPTPVPTPDGLCGGRFDVFTDGEIVVTETSWQSKDIAVFFEEVYEKHSGITGGELAYYLADIYVQNAERLRCGLAGGGLRATAHIKALAEDRGAVVALSGDFTGANKKGICVRNGVSYRTRIEERQDAGVFGRDGVLQIFEAGAYTGEEISALDPWHVWSFGPGLLDENGGHKETFHSRLYARNPRAVLGYYEPGHYCFVVVRGRTSASEGVSLKELSLLMERLGCAQAYNLDGGESAQLYWNGQIYHATNSLRKVNDIVYIAGPA